MEALELDVEQIRVLKNKAYEWRGKINKRHNRTNYFKTNSAIKRFKRFLKSEKEKFIPNKSEILLTMVWFLRCPPQNEVEKAIYMLIGLIYKLHKSKLSNLAPKEKNP